MSGVYFVEGTTVLLPGDRSIASGYNKAAADRFAAELNRLHAARYGSPEGWPEGAEKVTLGTLREAPDEWEATTAERNGEPVWFAAKDVVRDLAQFNNTFPMVARRKPKPVTRTEDVRAEELRPGMKPEGMKHADGSQVTLWKVLLTEVDGGLRVSAWSKTGVQTIFAVDAEQPIPVLVEEPNG